MRRVAFSDGKDGGDFEGEDEVVYILELRVCKVYQGVMFPASKTKSPTLVLVVSRVVMAAIGHVAAVEVFEIHTTRGIFWQRGSALLERRRVPWL
jgi:hypothetical protein